MPAFIESQFPIARLSAESYKERKAGASQTLTGLGKWWGRKPLILVRASILGMLMPASDNPKKDREIFLKILTMDDGGTIMRWKSSNRFGIADLSALASHTEREQWNELDGRFEDAQQKVKELRNASIGISNGDVATKIDAREAINTSVTDANACGIRLQEYIAELQVTVFNRLTYAERITRCDRPENIGGPTEEAWNEINSHLCTTASSLTELVEQLGQRTFGHTPRVGDCFCGGGSIPFEASRIGCQAFGSDLNPVACLLTWAGLNILGGGNEAQEEVRRVQEDVFAAADRQILDWGIDHNDREERAEAFLYCVEVKPEGCDYFIPLAPNWVISEKFRIVTTWHIKPGSDRLQPEVKVVSPDEFKLYKGKQGATAVDGRVIDPFDSTRSWSVEALRGPEGLRRWTNEDIVPKPSDVFQERLYCIRWINTEGKRRYAAPDTTDIAREEKVLGLLRERFADWQSEGFIPSKAIISGYNTDQPIRERGWTQWHHLFTPRQLLYKGLLVSESKHYCKSTISKISIILGVGSMANWESRLTSWDPWLSKSGGIGATHQTFYNQALNTLLNYPTKTLSLQRDYFFLPRANEKIADYSQVKATDARDVNETCDLWVTDPPYADAVNYHELGDFFLAWYDKQLAKAFPEWTPDARAELAVRGNGEDFRRSMVEIYRNLANHMTDNGLQMVMFTHQDPAVWA